MNYLYDGSGRLILSVNDAGVVSLWDSPTIRQSGARHEGYVDLKLTNEQLTAIVKAHGEAVERKVRQ